ncbi:MAG TPA: arylesterase [Vicinamibacterales bacterium]|nr:arylesterase [Vicinamibacterales bacterium]
MFVRYAAPGLLVAALAAGCGSSSSRDTDSASPAPGQSSAPARSAPAASPARVVFLGDSLTAGLGVAQSEAFPALVGEKLRAAGFDAQVVNAGISGDTAAGGRRRLDWALDGDVRVLVLALGANDGLRGNPVRAMKADLQVIIRQAKARGITVLLLGMEAPPNFGPEYTAEFRKAFRDLAGDEDVAFVPFFLDGVAGEPAFNQGDGLHPNAAGARRIADTVWTALAPLVEERLAGQPR